MDIYFLVSTIILIFTIIYFIYNFIKIKNKKLEIYNIEPKFREIFNILPVAVIVWDENFKVLDWNEVAEEIFGYTREEIIGKNYFDYIIPDYLKKDLKKVANNIIDLQTKNNINENITKEGKIIKCQWDVSIIKDEKNNFKYALSIGQDISDKIKSKEDLRISIEKLTEINDELYASNEELEESYSIIETLTGQIQKMIQLFNKFDQKDLKLSSFYDSLLSLVMDVMIEADYGSISIIEKNKWKFLAASGHNIEILQNLNLKKENAYIVYKPTLFKNLKDEKLQRFPSETVESFKKATMDIKESLVVSVKIDDNIFLNISIDIAKDSEKSFNSNSLILFQAFQNIASSYLKNKIYSQKIINSYLDFSRKLASIAEAYDDLTGKHIERVGVLSAFIAQKLGYEKDFVNKIRQEAPLHDIGKIFIDNSVLNKAGPLTEDEWIEMKKHTILADRLLSDEFFSLAKKIAFYHHEKWDGSGYPFGLKKDQIPIEAQIVSLVDVYDALRDERSYKKAFSHEKSVEIISEGDGRTRPEHFNPKLLDIFMKNEKEINEIYNNLNN